MKKWLKYLTGIVVCISAFVILSGYTTKLPDKPSNGVYDESNVVSQELVTKLDDYNKQLAKSSQQPQIALLVLKSLNGKTIETIANETARNWKVGFSPTNNGVLVVVAIDDKKMRIETSDNIATLLTDYETKQILDLAKNDFREKHYSQGIEKIISELTLQIANKMSVSLDTPIKSQRKASAYKDDSIGGIMTAIGVGIFIFLAVLGKRGRRRIYHRGVDAGDVLMGVMMGSSMKKHKRRKWDDDDDDDSFFGGFGSGGGSSSSGGWSGGGFSGGGSSSGW